MELVDEVMDSISATLKENSYEGMECIPKTT